MIEKNNKFGTTTAGTQEILGRLEKCHLSSLRPQQPFIILTVGEQPVTELTLRKDKITYWGASWGTKGPGEWEGRVETGEARRGGLSRGAIDSVPTDLGSH